jgi:acyl-coenzyme A thioesterase PaaI-like protein
MFLECGSNKEATTMNTAHRNEILDTWARFTRWPGGRWAFAQAIGLSVPYAGSIGARVTELSAGHAVATLAERRAVRNHLRSIHAVALVNLGELIANLALMSTQPRGTRWIVVGMESEYLRKARGLITARCDLAQPDWSTDGELVGVAELVDEGGAAVCRVQLRWRIGPKRA